MARNQDNITFHKLVIGLGFVASVALLGTLAYAAGYFIYRHW